MDIREGLAKRLRSGAAWRTAQGAEHPEDEGNRRSADALTELAGHVMTLPADDHCLEAIAGLSFEEDAFSGSGDEVDQLIARYGSNRHLQAHPDTFLRQLVGIADRNAQLSRRGGGATSGKASRALASPRCAPDASGPSGDQVASDFDPSGGASDFDPSGGASDFDPSGGASDFDPSGGASDFDPSGGASDPTESYGGLSKWDFRPPHHIRSGTITAEMVLEGEH